MPELDSDVGAMDVRPFLDDGYLPFQLLDSDEITALKKDIDQMVDGVNRSRELGRGASPQVRDRISRLVRSPVLQQLPAEKPRAHDMPHIGALTWHPKLMTLLDRIVQSWRPRAEWTLTGDLPPVLDVPANPDRSRYVFHHINAARHDAGTPGLPWHHDYDQFPQTNRSHLMLHALIYLNGLDGTIGDLALVPGTHRSVASKRALWFMGWQKLPGTVVIDRLPPGAAVVMHSAMFHARIEKPGGENRPRYFLDCSYSQASVRWPSAYHGSHRQLRERHLAAGGDRPWLFDDTLFFDAAAAHNVVEGAHGSLLDDGRHLPA